MTKHATVYWSLCPVTAAALVGGHQLVGAAPPQANAPLHERVAAIVNSDILAAGVPSVSVAVMRDGKMLLERAWGVADIEKNVGASNSTTYPVGSLTKQFTAALRHHIVRNQRSTASGLAAARASAADSPACSRS